MSGMARGSSSPTGNRVHRLLSPGLLPVLAGPLLLAGAGAVVLPIVELGPVSRHMATHIALMNIVAPIAAAACASTRCKPQAPRSATTLWTAAILQVVLLWAWHVPLVQNAASASLYLQIVSHIVLMLAASAFWLEIVSRVTPWQAVLALLVTGKLVCLIGALLIFAPRVLYDGGHAAHDSSVLPLADQHMAGLLMIAACPLSYILAGVIMSAQNLGTMSRQSDLPPSTLSAAQT